VEDLRTENKRRRNIRLWLIAGAALAALAVLAACGGGDEDQDQDTEATPTATRTRGPSPTQAPTARPTEVLSSTSIGITLSDFTVQPNQTRAQPGMINFQIENVGEVDHELVVVKSDLAIATLPRLPDNAGVDEDQLDVVGRSDPIGPGEEGEFSLELEVGKYVLICNMAPNGESHYLNGMYTGFETRTDVPQATTTATP
jgi:hypothetical protein